MVAIPFPNVPTGVKGVPPVNIAPGGVGGTTAPQSATPLMTQDHLGGDLAKTAWGIFDKSGVQVLKPDSVTAIEFSREFRISDYPVEAGGFASYNKVATPSDVRVTMTKGGSNADRSGFLDAVRALIETTDLFDIVTPDRTYTKRNLTRMDYRRTAQNGATLLTVELQCMEVRETAEATFTNSKAPSGATPAVNGPVRPAAPTAAQLPPAAATASTPAVAALPAISKTDATLDKLHKISDLAQAGATVADMVAAGASFQAIPLLAVPAQSISTTLGGQPVRLDVRQKAFGMHVDVFVNDALLLGGIMARNDTPLIRSPYLDFAGELFFRDTQGTADPTADTLSRFALLYAGA